MLQISTKQCSLQNHGGVTKSHCCDSQKVGNDVIGNTVVTLRWTFAHLFHSRIQLPSSGETPNIRCSCAWIIGSTDFWLRKGLVTLFVWSIEIMPIVVTLRHELALNLCWLCMDNGSEALGIPLCQCLFVYIHDSMRTPFVPGWAATRYRSHRSVWFWTAPFFLLTKMK